MCADAPAARFAFDCVTEKFNPALDQGQLISRGLRDFMAGAEDPHQRFQPLQALHQAPQQVGDAQASTDIGGASAHPYDDLIALGYEHQKLLFILDR